jgi:transposase
MVLETIKATGERHGVVTRVGLELGIGSETLRHWVKRAEVDQGLRPGVTTADQPEPRDSSSEKHGARVN